MFYLEKIQKVKQKSFLRGKRKRRSGLEDGCETPELIQFDLLNINNNTDMFNYSQSSSNLRNI